MTEDAKQLFAAKLQQQLDSRRDVFVVDSFLFEPFDSDNDRSVVQDVSTAATRGVQKTVSAACLKLLLDYCESAWDMPFVDYCAAVFHGREPREGETAFDLLPDVRQRVSADRLGLGHIYGGGKE
jgi:hypothetical protein